MAISSNKHKNHPKKCMWWPSHVSASDKCYKCCVSVGEAEVAILGSWARFSEAAASGWLIGSVWLTLKQVCISRCRVFQ